MIFLGNTYPWGQLTTIAIGLQYSISGDAGVDLFTLHLGSYQFTFQRATFNGIQFLNLGQDGSVSNLDGLLGLCSMTIYAHVVLAMFCYIMCEIISILGTLERRVLNYLGKTIITI